MAPIVIHIPGERWSAKHSFINTELAILHDVRLSTDIRASLDSSSNMVARLIDRVARYPTDISSFTVEQTRSLIRDVGFLFRTHLIENGVEQITVGAMTRKFRDAGRRSPPWREGSDKGARRPQDGENGNRRNRWLFETDHEFYADEVTATLTEVRFYLQTLSMQDAPPLPNDRLKSHFAELLGHELSPGSFIDPIQKIPVSFPEFCRDHRYVEAGHITPLGRGGKHVPSNSTLMLKSSNRLQSDKTIPELMDLMKAILRRNGYTIQDPPDEGANT